MLKIETTRCISYVNTFGVDNNHVRVDVFVRKSGLLLKFPRIISVSVVGNHERSSVARIIVGGKVQLIKTCSSSTRAVETKLSRLARIVVPPSTS